MFLPMSTAEAQQRGWKEFDVIFVTGDAYVDHPSFGVPLLGRWLESHGFRVGIIAQPDWRQKESFQVLGRPRLFFAVSAGAMDSMVAHYTPQKKLRRDDAYTPGNRHGARPNRATIVYTGRLKEAYKDVPVVIGGIEASMRRFAHYDFWDDSVRRSILFDSKADLLVYGMGERPLLELAQRLRGGEPFDSITDIRGTAHIAPAFPSEAVAIPSWEDVKESRLSFAEAFRYASLEQNHAAGRIICQGHGGRWLCSNPPALPLLEAEMDALYGLPFTRLPHPSYSQPIPAHEQIKTSVTSHRGCFGGCSFCAITQHQGKGIQSRSEASILKEIRDMATQPWFKGSVSDVGGPTANMYGIVSADVSACQGCVRESCLWPKVCKVLRIDDTKGARLLKRIRAVQGVKHVAVSSGVRYDLLEFQPNYLKELVAHHVSGLLKVAPEHVADGILRLMRKPGRTVLERFIERFRLESQKIGKRQYLVPYFMAGHPGCSISDMADAALFMKSHDLRVEQVQEFTPTPGTLSTCMYYAGLDPITGESVTTCKGEKERRLQKELLLWRASERKRELVELLLRAGRGDAVRQLFGESANVVGREKRMRTKKP